MEQYINISDLDGLNIIIIINNKIEKADLPLHIGAFCKHIEICNSVFMPCELMVVYAIECRFKSLWI